MTYNRHGKLSFPFSASGFSLKFHYIGRPTVSVRRKKAEGGLGGGGLGVRVGMGVFQVPLNINPHQIRKNSLNDVETRG